MGLLWAGIIESVAAASVGVWLYETLPARDHIWAQALWLVALATLAISVSLGRRSAISATEALPHQPSGSPAPPSTTSEPMALPAPSTPIPLPGASGAPQDAPSSLESLWPSQVDELQRAVVKSRWTIQAAESQARAGALAQAILQADNDTRVEERTRQTRRLADYTILAQGFQSLSEGRRPVFDLGRFQKAFTFAQIASRLVDLTEEEQALRAEMAMWMAGPESSDDPKRLVVEATVKHEHLKDVEQRWEQLFVLRQGYHALREGLKPEEGAQD